MLDLNDIEWSRTALTYRMVRFSARNYRVRSQPTRLHSPRRVDSNTASSAVVVWSI